MKLYCVRHAEAVSAIEDPERPLTLQGTEDVRAIAQHFLTQSLRVSQVIHSQRLRAKQTAEILVQALNPQTVTESKTGLDETDSIDELVDQIEHWQDDTMLVGHMPFMSRLVSALVVDEPYHHLINFVPGTVVCLEKQAQQWLVSWVLVPELFKNR